MHAACACQRFNQCQRTYNTPSLGHLLAALHHVLHVFVKVCRVCWRQALITCLYSLTCALKINVHLVNVSTWTHIVAHMPPALHRLKLQYIMNTSVCLKENLGHCYPLIVIIQKENHLFYLFIFNILILLVLMH